MVGFVNLLFDDAVQVDLLIFDWVLMFLLV